MDERQWVCSKCGAVLGVVAWNGSKTPQLLVYRHGVDLKAARPARVDVVGAVTGKVGVECDVCGEVRVWWPSAQAVLALLDGMGVDQLRQFVEAFLGRNTR